MYCRRAISFRRALITGIRSDLPGQITAQVTENVFDVRPGVSFSYRRGHD
jgi:hypothetical protein